MTKTELLQKVDVLLGGRAAETIVFGDISTGASDDLNRATDIVRSMITQYGMGSSLGPVTVDRERTPVYVTQGEISTGKNFSEETARKIDEEVRQTMAERLDRVLAMLRRDLTLLKEVATELLEKESLNEEEFQNIIRRHQPVPVTA
jgi:cell division protease FtsH